MRVSFFECSFIHGNTLIDAGAFVQYRAVDRSERDPALVGLGPIGDIEEATHRDFGIGATVAQTAIYRAGECPASPKLVRRRYFFVPTLKAYSTIWWRE